MPQQQVAGLSSKGGAARGAPTGSSTAGLCRPGTDPARGWPGAPRTHIPVCCVQLRVEAAHKPGGDRSHGGGVVGWRVGLRQCLCAGRAGAGTQPPQQTARPAAARAGETKREPQAQCSSTRSPGDAHAGQLGAVHRLGDAHRVAHRAAGMGMAASSTRVRQLPSLSGARAVACSTTCAVQRARAPTSGQCAATRPAHSKRLDMLMSVIT